MPVRSLRAARPRSRRTAAVVAAGAAATLVVTGCAPGLSLVSAPVAAQSRAVISSELVGGTNVDVAQPIVVTSTDGRLTDVVVTGPKGPVPGSVSDDGSAWASDAQTMAFGATYTVQASAVDSRGVPTTLDGSFTTLVPEERLSGAVNPSEGSTFGVGMPIYVRFNHDVKNKKAVERNLKILTSNPVEGAWNWTSDDEVVFRPATYWPGNTQIVVKLALKGVKAAPGLYGTKTEKTRFQTGDSMVSKVNAAAHTLTVVKNGQVVRSFPVTTGKSGFETRSGVKVVLTKERSRIMDAATGGTSEGDPEYYRVEAEYAMRMTWSGEFLHAAPWSVGSQGSANVSHGCVGMSTANAQWLYDQTLVGDVVEVTGTSRTQDDGNGITVWNDSFEEWQEGSAFAGTPKAVVTTIPLTTNG
ncbi:MAG: Ig-like domain-containing protein [Candidatus Nanopelagicales bacterium]